MRKKWEEPKAEQQEAGDSSKQQQEGQRQTLGIQATDGAADDGTATAPAGDTGSLSVHKPARCVAFAQGPLADKYSTQDGHPDHEGKVGHRKPHCLFAFISILAITKLCHGS